MLENLVVNGAHALSDTHKALIPTAMPKDAQLLLSSRIQMQLFCLTSKQTVHDVSFLGPWQNCCLNRLIIDSLLISVEKHFIFVVGGICLFTATILIHPAVLSWRHRCRVECWFKATVQATKKWRSFDPCGSAWKGGGGRRHTRRHF